jgi:hypothetical protein
MGILVHRSEDETEIGAGQSSALSDAGYGGTIWQKKRSASCGRGGAGEGNISELLPPRGHRGLDVVPRNRSGMSRLELIVLHSKNADGCNAR